MNAPNTQRVITIDSRCSKKSSNTNVSKSSKHWIYMTNYCSSKQQNSNYISIKQNEHCDKHRDYPPTFSLFSQSVTKGSSIEIRDTSLNQACGTVEPRIEGNDTMLHNWKHILYFQVRYKQEKEGQVEIKIAERTVAMPFLILLYHLEPQTHKLESCFQSLQ